MDYRLSKSLEERQAESAKILKAHPGRCPFILESNSPDLKWSRKKMLVPKDLAWGEFLFSIRRRLKLPPEGSLLILISNKLPAGNSLVGEVYENYKDNDDFCYGIMMEENTFGYGRGPPLLHVV
uniref:Autophagy-related protein n=1 Tax=viral metagenome TaxID=1070528 RepID=A0A6C0BPL8_9ZZZZ